MLSPAWPSHKMSIAALNTALVDHCLDAIEEILLDCNKGNGDTGADNETAAGASSSLRGCGAPIVALLGRQAVAVLKVLSLPATEPVSTLIARRIDDLIELAHARFYAHVPSEVPVCWLQLYTDASILKFALAYGEQRHTDVKDIIGSLVRPLDMALILAGGAGPPSRGRMWIHASLEYLHKMLNAKGGVSTENPLRPSKRPRLSDGIPLPGFSSGPMFNQAAGCHFVPPVCHPVPRSGPLGLTGFQSYIDRARNDSLGHSQRGPQPLVMSGLIENWPAIRADARPWASPDYLRWCTLGGQRLVPVEVGRSYVDEGWRQEIVSFESVLQALQADGQPETKGTMYLAQHALFTQIPKLRDDIIIPDACYSVTDGSTSDGDDGCPEEPMLNAWLGPGGTITPLHTDPHHNLLAQVVGRKYVRLYSPEQTAGLRPRGREGGVEMGNTSAVDVGVMEGWDEPEYLESGDEQDARERERFLSLPYMDCILEPSDTLYIPRGWWHYVRGLSVSFSVSFWWD